MSVQFVMLHGQFVIENQEIGFTKLKGGTESILALHRILADNVTHNYVHACYIGSKCYVMDYTNIAMQ